MRKNPTLIILALIMLVNAFSYGIIIPLLYPFSARFGINALGLSLLFASFSAAQLIATPIIGRLSDKYGRKPMLLLSLFGTAVSLALFASAGSVTMLFVARILDGITGGNNSVAQAVIADSTKGKDRAQGFGILGAAFGFGFLFGPAIGGFLSTISLATPFWFASALALIGTLAGVVFMKETLTEENRQRTSEKYFNTKNLISAFTNPLTGIVLAIIFIFTLGLNIWIIGFQTFTNDVLKLPARDIGMLFAGFGLIQVIMQSVGIRDIIKRIPNKNTIVTWSLLFSVIALSPLYFVHGFQLFFVIVMIYGIVSSPISPVITAILSERTKTEDQGGIMGINQSIISFGQILGPLIAGFIAIRSVNLVFALAAMIVFIALISTKHLHATSKAKLDL